MRFLKMTGIFIIDVITIFLSLVLFGMIIIFKLYDVFNLLACALVPFILIEFILNRIRQHYLETKYQ